MLPFGQRVRLLKSPGLDPRFAGLTGVLERSRDGIEIVIDRPLPRCALDYEDTRTGHYILVSHEDMIDDPPPDLLADGMIEPIAADTPAHSGVGDGPSPLVAGMLESIASNLGPGVESLQFGDSEVIDLAGPREFQPATYQQQYGEYLAGQARLPHAADYGLDERYAQRIRISLEQAKALAARLEEPFHPAAVPLPDAQP